jgi:hypothetical protein
MNRLEKQFLEMVAQERLAVSRNFNRMKADRFGRPKWMQDWTTCGWTLHGHFMAILARMFGSTDGSGLAADLLGEIDYGGRHDPPWKGIASHLALAGKAEAGGSDRFLSDCSQSEPLYCLPTGLNARGPSDCSNLISGSDDSSDSSDHSEGRTEHRDGILLMVTSALKQDLRIPSQGSDR